MLQVGPSLDDGYALATPRRKQMGVTATPSRPDSCCVSDAITHDDRPNISSSSSRHGAKQRGGLYPLDVVVNSIQIWMPVFYTQDFGNILLL